MSRFYWPGEKHGPGGQGGPGPCDPDCVKCRLQNETESLRVVITRRVDGAEVYVNPRHVTYKGKPVVTCDCTFHRLFYKELGITPGAVQCGRELYALRLEVDGQPTWSSW